MRTLTLHVVLLQIGIFSPIVALVLVALGAMEKSRRFTDIAALTLGPGLASLWFPSLIEFVAAGSLYGSLFLNGWASYIVGLPLSMATAAPIAWYGRTGRYIGALIFTTGVVLCLVSLSAVVLTVLFRL